MANQYVYGQTVTITLTNTRTSNDALTDPSSSQAQVKDPSGTVEAASPASGTTGIETLDIEMDEVGTFEWWYEATFANGKKAAAQGEVECIATIAD